MTPRRPTKCPTCRSTAVTLHHEDRPLDGLPTVLLRGLRITRCTDCGAEAVSIPRLEQLHEVVAEALVHKPGRLTGPEVRYLRKWLGWSGRDFAKHFDLTPEHISRIENGHLPISGLADRLLRVLALHHTTAPQHSPEDLLDVGDDPAPLQLGLRATGRRWSAVA